jgi:signal transduction histidine kinase
VHEHHFYIDILSGIRQHGGMKAVCDNRTRSRGPVLFMLLSSLVFAHAGQTTELPVLIHVRQVRDLSVDQTDQRHPVCLRGVVTFCNMNADEGLFLQDDTGGVYVKLPGQTNFMAGDALEVRGIADPGYYMPIVIAEHVRQLGRADLPTPDRVGYDQLASGKEDSQWVEVQGVVRSVNPETKGRTHVWLLLNGRRFGVVVTHSIMAEAERLICATIRIRGVCRCHYNSKRQLNDAFLCVDGISNIVVEVPASQEIPEVPLSSLLRFNSKGYYGRRVMIQGVVTEQKSDALFIQDGRTGLYFKSSQPERVSPGSVVQVTGFPVLAQFIPTLEDATFHVIGHQSPPVPLNISVDELPSGNYDALLVRLRARVVNLIERPDEQVLVLDANHLLLNARLDFSQADHSFMALQKGSELELTGVCMAQPWDNWKMLQVYRPEVFQLLLRSSNDVTLIRKPPWWTLSRSLWMLAIMSVVLLAGFLWVFALNRRVRRQTAIIEQKLHRETMIEERSRIAREFHDTLEQELVAITIQLDTVEAQFHAAPGFALKMLDLARNLARHSLVEARRSVWDLRSHLLESSDLLTAISQVVKLMVASSEVPISIQNSGTPRKLPMRVENNLLRIAQEALANAIKHAHASRIDVTLDYRPGKVCLRVNDDGIGFETGSAMPVFGGHFGLEDMSERTKKMGGAFSLISVPGQGTEIIVEVVERSEASRQPVLKNQEQLPATEPAIH